MKCNTCQNEDYCYDGNHEITRYGCTDNGFAAYAPLTNADRIRAMTDEELARFITGEDFCELLCKNSPSFCNGDCEKWMLSWLKAPVEEVDK